MIPDAIADDAAPGERDAFVALRDAPGTDDWIVLHSLAIGRHVTQREGEADFVVLAPGHGILDIEVKSHLRVQTDSSGRWKLGNDDWTSRSPFEQASGEFHSILQFLRQRALDPVGYPTGYAVWFTSIARQNIPLQSDGTSGRYSMPAISGVQQRRCVACSQRWMPTRRQSSPVIATQSASPHLTAWSGIGQQRILVGDTVQTRRNDRLTGVENRAQWIVRGIRDEYLSLVSVSDSGEVSRVSTEYAREHLQLSYASTVHGVQGDTADASVVGPDADAAGLYVGLTRGRFSNVAIVVARTDAAARECLAESMQRGTPELAMQDAVRAAEAEMRRAARNREAATVTGPVVGAPRAGHGLGM